MKKTRHRKIVEIIEKRDVETQEELAGYLKEAGFAVTQATVSRDIRDQFNNFCMTAYFHCISFLSSFFSLSS